MEKVLDKRSFADGLLRIILIVLTISVIAAPVTGTLFTFLSEDDFSYESGGIAGAEQYQSSFWGSVHKVHDIYMGQQGCFTPMFLDHFIRPYSRWGMPGFHACMFIYVTLFVGSVYAVARVISKDRTVSLTVFFASMMSIFAMSGTRGDRDIFFWYTETLGFTLLMAFVFFALFFCILAFREKGAKSVVYLVISSVLSFFASGASLNVTALHCSLLLAVIILDYEEVKGRKYLVASFVAGFIGALINAAAPGNFVRADEEKIPGHETVFDAIRDTFSCYFKALPTVMDIVFILMLLLIIVFCILYRVEVLKGGITGIRMLIVVGGIFLTQYFVIFPGAFGNHTDHLEEHVALEYYLAARLTTIFVAMCFSQYLSGKLGDIKKYSKGLAAASAVLAILLLVLPAARNIYHDSFSGRTFRDLTSGTFTRVYRIREYEISYFEMAEDGSDSVLFVPWDVSSESLPGLGISSDSEWIVNVSAANLFRLHTATVLTP